MIRVALLTDNDFTKVNGVTTTLKAVLQYAPEDIAARVYTMSDTEVVADRYTAWRSFGVGLPWYSQMRIHWPRLRCLSAALRAQQPQLLHLTTPGPVGLAGRYLAFRHHWRTVGSFHTNLGDYARALGGGSVAGRGAGLWLDAYMRWLYRSSDRVLVPSDQTRHDLIEQGYDPQRLTVWTRGVDAHQFSPLRRSNALRSIWKASLGCPVLLYVGRLSREKGLHRLVSVSDRLTSLGVRFQLVIAGDGPMRDALVARLPAAHFVGELPHAKVGEAMASADVFVFPSDTDTFGNVVLEAQASGLPAVVTTCGGPREAMVDGRTGFACDGDAIEVFAAHLARLLTDAELRRQFSEDARTQAEGRDWHHALAPLYDGWRASARLAALSPYIASSSSIATGDGRP